MDNRIDRLGETHVFDALDVLLGCWGVPVKGADKGKVICSFDYGTYHYTRMLFCQ